VSHRITNRRPPSVDIALGRVALGLADLLAREMDHVVQQALEQMGPAWESPADRAAQKAYRIVVLCRSLIDEITAYEAAYRTERPWETGLPF
jgi:hypothetical protein